MGVVIKSRLSDSSEIVLLREELLTLETLLHRAHELNLGYGTRLRDLEIKNRALSTSLAHACKELEVMAAMLD